MTRSMSLLQLFRRRHLRITAKAEPASKMHALTGDSGGVIHDGCYTLAEQVLAVPFHT